MNLTTTIVNKYVGKMLMAHGFEFKRIRAGDCEFIKHDDGSIQKVLICKHRYDNKLYFELRSHSRKGGGSFRVEDLDIGVSDSDWHFSSQEDINCILTQMSQIIEQYGFAVMDMAIEKVKDLYIYSDAMARLVYYDHEQYAKKFIEENSISEDECDDSTIEQWFKIIARKFTNLKKSGSIKDIDDELTKIASFIGIKVTAALNGKWELYYDKTYNYQRCFINITGSHLFPTIDILKDLEDVYNEKDYFSLDRLCNNYKEMFKGR